jgi:glycosyltransferase involved in cell wall biosynthesis
VRLTQTPATPTIAVLLPAYNEAATIADTIHGFAEALPEAEIWVIDNASTDGTGAIAAQALQASGSKGGVLAEARKGKANAVRRAFIEIDADAFLMADADLTYPPARAREMLAPILEGRADMVVGDRHSGGHYAAENKRPMHGLGNRLVQEMVNRLFRANLSDIMSGYRAFNRRFAKSYPIIVEGFEIESDMTLHALDKRFRIAEIAVEYRDRPPGSVSKLSTYRDGARVIWVILQLFRYYQPLPFFGGLSAAMLLFALAAAVPVFSDWVHYRYIYHVPLAILAAASVIVSTVLLAIGLVLDGISHQAKMRYELHVLDRG